MKKLAAPYLFVFLLSACSGNESFLGEGGNTVQEIAFGGGIGYSVTSRAPIESENDLVTEEVTGIQIIRDNAASNPFNDNIITTAVAAGKITTVVQENKNVMEVNPLQYIGISNPNANIMAYHPAGDLQNGKVVYTIDGSQDIIVSGMDYVKYGEKRSIDLVFTHKLARIKLNIVSDDTETAQAYGNLISATINVPTKLELSLNNRTFELNKAASPEQKNVSFNTAQIPLISGTNEIGELMIYPEIFTSITLGFTNKPSQNYPIDWWYLSGDGNIQPGRKYTLTITLKAYGIGLGIEVDPWGVGNNGDDLEIGGT